MAEPEGDVAATYKQMARQMAVELARRTRDATGKLPTITLSRDT
jgi:ATP-binding protein involved in chromosome partitioning